ncbi:MAG TPA: divergent polysaccharide deacetylase family protein [Thermoanaerobaculia bacterium]|nr:divergent polysaccharide deacetylase family protein [Thermoanaerobaculia bacterium]
MTEAKRGEKRRPVPRRDPLGPRPPFRVIGVTIGLPLLAFLAFILYQWGAGKKSAITAPPQPPGEARSTPPPPARSPSKPAPAAAKPLPERGRIALILDDVGYDARAARRAAGLGVPLSFAVIPGTPHASDAAEYLARRGFEILCHLPMEPEGYPAVAPGDGAILTSMGDEEIRERTLAMLRSIPHAKGVNNHMGSAATTDPRVMGSVLGALRDEGVFFVDSRTTSRSVSIEVARELGVRSAARDVFLDDDRTEGAVRRQLAALARSADGSTAVGIGHLYPSTLRVLEDELPRLRASGYRFVTVSSAVRK